MRKNIFIVCACSIALLALSSCKSTQGCGLTSDTYKVTPTPVTTPILEVVTE
jgi:hypothetical protein